MCSIFMPGGRDEVVFVFGLFEGFNFSDLTISTVRMLYCVYDFSIVGTPYGFLEAVDFTSYAASARAILGVPVFSCFSEVVCSKTGIS